ncbi:MAG: GNAT family N-acetyltransferase [Anderseniella sp.]
MKLELASKLDLERAHYFAQLGSYFDNLIDEASIRYAFSSSLQDIWYNQAYGFSKPIDDVKGIIDKVREKSESFRKDPCLYIIDDLVSDKLAQQLGDAGFLEFENELWMAKTELSSDVPQVNEFRVVSISSENEIEDFKKVYRKGLPGGEVETYINCALNHILHPPALMEVNYLVAYSGDKAVGMYGLICFETYSAAYAVATIPGFQRRGVFSALSATAERMAVESGARILFLQTVQGELGEKAFRSEGYEDAFSRLGFAPKEIVEGLTHG